ncbi:hypothetical protein HPB52_023657 [Rhipicephalus sanguineus]|uniref:CCHC-type domain-containing protein n=1 Tax=Rhipicephalus sanguineus TaxID=34632 RepID=A0A9D4Q911_RHISA|nr:hypothetical protein HPB52_023657 [Rhipicephalus sanguineus]
MATETDVVKVPEELLQHLLGQTNGSAIQHEQIAAAISQRLMTAEPMPAGPMTAAAFQPTGDCAPRSAGSQPPRLSHVVPAALEGSAKLWLRFVKSFSSWDNFKTLFIAEFSSSDVKQRLRQELELHTLHSEENLKEFIYTITAYYDRISDEQMHSQLQDLVEGKQFANLAELAKAADGLMECYWRWFQYKPLPPPTNQIARDLAFQPAVNVAGLSGVRPGVTMAAAAAPLQHPSAASYWPLHSMAIQPSYHRNQLHRSPTSATRSHFPAPPQPQGYQPLDSGGTACHRCGGIGHITRECPSGLRGTRWRECWVNSERAHGNTGDGAQGGGSDMLDMWHGE